YSILTTGDGGIYSNSEDLYKFDQALRNNTLINKKIPRLCTPPSKLSRWSSFKLRICLVFGGE
ncbi:hypothetical protein, partial [Chryseobacterium sp. CH1]|uniref:hypothetical protein n=1 Tax=Chryseobacterium sp. CH1 TaxID=713551 RepID=UPI001E310EEF